MSDKPPKPKLTPMPFVDAPDADTGEFSIVSGPLLRAKLKKVSKRAGRISAGSVVGAVGIAFGAFFAVRADVQAQIDAGHKTQAARDDLQDERAGLLKDEQRRMAEQVDRTEKKVDLLLDVARVPNSKRPKADGGE